MGKQIPKDFKVVGYDGTQLIRNLNSQLTTIIQPIDLIASKAIEILEKRLNHEPTKQEYILPIKLWEGTSG